MVHFMTGIINVKNVLLQLVDIIGKRKKKV
jgi:hypothetical protein